MNHSALKGLSFGLTSGIITTLGLIVGLHSSTNSKTAIIGGVLVIAIADALSDSLGIHISEESRSKNAKQIWISTIATFFSKFVFALTFIVPILLFQLFNAIIISIAWGLIIIALFSYYIAKQQKENPFRVVFEHLFIAILVIFIAHYVGDWVATFKDTNT